MTQTPHTTAGLAVDTYTSPVNVDRIASPNGRPTRDLPQLRKYEVAHLTHSQDIVTRSILGPATPAFEDAFAVFGRGTLIMTTSGPVAVEDLIPGDQVLTPTRGAQTVLWHGAMTVLPDDDCLKNGSIIRVSSDMCSLEQIGPDLVLGPAARVLRSSEHAKMLTGSKDVFIPAHDLADGYAMISLRPVSAVQFYQIGFAHHQAIKVNGQLVETLHPGPAHSLPMRAALLDHYLSMFGHVYSLADFGEMAAPRLRQADLDLLVA